MSWWGSACLDRSYCDLYRSATPSQSEAPSASTDQAGPTTALVLTPRSNPRHLFVRNQLPSTEASSSVTASPERDGDGKASPELDQGPSPSRPAGEQHNQITPRSPAAEQMQEEDEEEDEDEDVQLTDAQVNNIYTAHTVTGVHT